MATRRPSKRAKTHNPNDFADYNIEITGWSWGYHFGLEPRRDADDWFWESKQISVRGQLIGEVGVRYHLAEFFLIPDAGYDRHRRIERSQRALAQKPSNVGTVHVRGDALYGLFTVPMEAVPALLSVLSGNQFKYMLIRGAKLLRRRADIWGYSLETWVDPDDLAGP